MITDSEFQRIVTYVKKHYGIDLSQKRVLVGGRLENYLARNGYANYNEFMEKVRQRKTQRAPNPLISSISLLQTIHTSCVRANTSTL